MALLERLQAEQGTALVVITHEPTSPRRAARTIELRDGRIVVRSDVSLREAFRVALQALLANRLRSALTTLGVLIGVMSVVLLVAIGQGARQEITGAIEGLGSNLLFVLPGDGDFGAGSRPQPLRGRRRRAHRPRAARGRRAPGGRLHRRAASPCRPRGRGSTPPSSRSRRATRRC
jgi:hypothetical protein